MTPRLRFSYHDPGWSELFSAGHSLRKMRVMADAELLGGVPGSGAVEDLLAGLLTHEDVQLWRYSDNGPPPGTAQLTSMSGHRVAVGWAVAEPVPGGTATHMLAWSVGQQAFRADLVGEPVLAASTDSRTEAYQALDPDKAAARRTADAVAACAASQIRADLYITNREYLHRLTRPIGRGVTFCTTREALALVGLYLRTQGEFLIWKDHSSSTPYTFDKGLYYWIGARELLPAGWCWYAACVAHSEGRGQAADAHDLTYLGGAVFQRITRVLQARDDLLRAMNRKQDNNVAEDALTALDVCLVFLMGALDAAARVAHRVLGLQPDRANQAGWQRRSGWLQDVAAREPPLAAVVAVGTAGADTLTILSRLRNTVHEAGLPALAIGFPGRREGTLVGLPRADSDRILEAADRRGGRDAWGLQELLPGRLHADPGVLLDRLLPQVIELLNELMTATPVGQLSGVSLKPEDRVPLRGLGGAFSERERHSIRWQLGL
jgi:hypothetical protein